MMWNVKPATNEDLMKIINTLRACKIELEKECEYLRDKNDFFKSQLAKKDRAIKRLAQRGGIAIKVDEDNMVTISIL